MNPRKGIYPFLRAAEKGAETNFQLRGHKRPGNSPGLKRLAECIADTNGEGEGWARRRDGTVMP